MTFSFPFSFSFSFSFLTREPHIAFLSSFSILPLLEELQSAGGWVVMREGFGGDPLSARASGGTPSARGLRAFGDST